MLTMIGKRLLFAIPSLIGVVIVTFLLTRALPGDPAAYFAGPAATKEAVEQIAFADQHRLLPRAYLWGLADTVRTGVEGRGIGMHQVWGKTYYGNPPRLIGWVIAP